MGSTPAVSLDKGPMIEESEKDPVFVLTKLIGRPTMEEIARKQRAAIEKEIET